MIETDAWAGEHARTGSTVINAEPQKMSFLLLSAHHDSISPAGDIKNIASAHNSSRPVRRIKNRQVEIVPKKVF